MKSFTFSGFLPRRYAWISMRFPPSGWTSVNSTAPSAHITAKESASTISPGVPEKFLSEIRARNTFRRFPSRSVYAQGAADIARIKSRTCTAGFVKSRNSSSLLIIEA